jgi:hypothetical protein
MNMTARDLGSGGAVLLVRDSSQPHYFPEPTTGAARVELWARDASKGIDAAFKVAEGKPGGEFSIPNAVLTNRDLLFTTISYSASNTPSTDLARATWQTLSVEAGTLEFTEIITETVNTADVMATGDGSFDGELRAVGKVIAEDGLAVGNSANASTPGTVIKKIEVFNAAGASIGFVPVYDDIT